MTARDVSTGRLWLLMAAHDCSWHAIRTSAAAHNRHKHVCGLLMAAHRGS